MKRRQVRRRQRTIRRRFAVAVALTMVASAALAGCGGISSLWHGQGAGGQGTGTVGGTGGHGTGTGTGSQGGQSSPGGGAGGGTSGGPAGGQSPGSTTTHAGGTPGSPQGSGTGHAGAPGSGGSGAGTQGGTGAPGGTSNPPAGTGSASGGTAGSTPGAAGGASGSGGGAGSGSGAGEQPGGGMTMVSYNGVQVEVPSGWTRTAVHGGDYGGYRYTNPADPKQSITLVVSSCVGCYLDDQGQPDPRKVIPVPGATDVTPSADGLSVRFHYQPANSPYPGVGMVTVSKDMAGYAYVEVVVPAANRALAESVLASFTVSL